jgi:hypothetical protein
MTVVDDPKVPASRFGFGPLKRRHRIAPQGGDLGVPRACRGHAEVPHVMPSNISADPSASRIGCVASDKGVRCRMRSVRNEVWNAVRPTGSRSVTEITPVLAPIGLALDREDQAFGELDQFHPALRAHLVGRARMGLQASSSISRADCDGPHHSLRSRTKSTPWPLRVDTDRIRESSSSVGAHL